MSVELDIRGEVCPYTFVKSKLAIEGIEAGEQLRILVDYQPATENVTRSFETEGHEVVGVEPIDEGEWAITVRKAR